MRRALVAYHRIDFDGICSYAVIRKALVEAGYEVTPFPFNHGDAEPDAALLPGFDRVVVADISFKPETMKALLDRHGDSFIWIDHHLTSIRESEENGYAGAQGLREVGRGACELAWEFFHPDAGVPLAVALLGAYDVFDKARFDWEGVVLPFQYAMRERYGLDVQRFAGEVDGLGPERVAGLVEAGRAILSYARSTGERGVCTYGFPVKVAGNTPAVCCLTNQFGSLAFEARMERDGVAVCVCANRLAADRYKVSLFGIEGRNTLNLGAYCKERYGGGGHFNAAGCIINTWQFLRLVTEGVI